MTVIKVFKNIIIFGLYTSLTLIFSFVIDYNNFIKYSGATFFILIYVRIFKLTALRKINPIFNGNQLKAFYQESGNLKKYQKLVSIVEIVGVIIAVTLLIIGVITII